MSTTLSHRGYTGTAEVSLEDGCLIGRVLHIRDIIAYEGETIAELETAFQSAVDDYLAFCQEAGKSPDKPYSGTFNVRIGPERHRKLAELAASTGASMNDTLNDVLDAGLYARPQPEITINVIEGVTEKIEAVSTSSNAVIKRISTTSHCYERASVIPS